MESRTKLIFSNEVACGKRKNKDEFGLNSLRNNFIARTGYNNFGIYASYSPTLLFKKVPEASSCILIHKGFRSTFIEKLLTLFEHLSLYSV